MTPPAPVSPIAIALQAKVSIGMAPPPWPYLAAAKSLSRGLKPLAAAGQDTLVPLTFVAAQVVECALKAYLSRTGEDSRLKKPSLRHNLTDLWSLAASEGLAINQPPPGWLGVLASMHKAPYAIRYPAGSLQFLPAAEPMATEILDLVQTIESTLRPVQP